MVAIRPNNVKKVSIGFRAPPKKSPKTPPRSVNDIKARLISNSNPALNTANERTLNNQDIFDLDSYSTCKIFFLNSLSLFIPSFENFSGLSTNPRICGWFGAQRKTSPTTWAC